MLSNSQFINKLSFRPALVSQVTETQCAPTGTVYRIRSRVQFPGWP